MPRRSRTGAPPERFVLTYRSDRDPEPDHVAKAMDQLRPAATAVEQVLPGVIAVQGEAAALRRATSALPDWRLAREGRLSLAPPARNRVRD